jgi:ABC-type branched-subunit amino acid transport system ATPase component
MTAELLSLTDVHAYYGESHILHGVDLSVKKGEVVALLGRNGSGRTTLLNPHRRPGVCQPAAASYRSHGNWLLPRRARHFFGSELRRKPAAAADD